MGLPLSKQEALPHPPESLEEAKTPELAEAFFWEVARNLDLPLIQKLQGNLLTNEECEANPKFAAARTAWRHFMSLTGGAHGAGDQFHCRA